jgi:hypothetical protein
MNHVGREGTPGDHPLRASRPPGESAGLSHLVDGSAERSGSSWVGRAGALMGLFLLFGGCGGQDAPPWRRALREGTVIQPRGGPPNDREQRGPDLAGSDWRQRWSPTMSQPFPPTRAGDLRQPEVPAAPTRNPTSKEPPPTSATPSASPARSATTGVAATEAESAVSDLMLPEEPKAPAPAPIRPRLLDAPSRDERTPMPETTDPARSDSAKNADQATSADPGKSADLEKSARPGGPDSGGPMGLKTEPPPESRTVRRLGPPRDSLSQPTTTLGRPRADAPPAPPANAASKPPDSDDSALPPPPPAFEVPPRARPDLDPDFAPLDELPGVRPAGTASPPPASGRTGSGSSAPNKPRTTLGPPKVF